MVEPTAICGACNERGHKPTKCPALNPPPDSGSMPSNQRYDDPDDHDHDDSVELVIQATET